MTDMSCPWLTGRPRTNTLEEFFGEDTGFFDLQSQIQLARRQRQGGAWSSNADGAHGSYQQGSASPIAGESKLGMSGLLWS